MGTSSAPQRALPELPPGAVDVLQAATRVLAGVALRSLDVLGGTVTLPQFHGSPAASARLGTITWPPGSIPVSVLRGHRHRDPDPALISQPADRISLLAPAPAGDRAEVPGQAGNP